MRGLARAFNDRLRSGIGNGGQRIAKYWVNLFRQLRNPDETGFVFPSQAEFFEIYQQLDPENNTGQYPVTGPGEPEGGNVANPMMQYIFGLAGSVDGEFDRLNEPYGVQLWMSTQAPATLAEWWALGKLQRGVIDPVRGEQNVPAMEAAQSWFGVGAPPWSPHGKSEGGFFPEPELVTDDCGGGSSSDPGFGVPSYKYKFTGLRTDVSTAGLHGVIGADANGNPICEYQSSCPPGSFYGASGDVWGIMRLPFATYVAVATHIATGEYAIDRFPVKDWIEGLYTGEGVLQRRDGNQLDRAVWSFFADFRGTRAQRAPEDYDIEEVAFGNEGFFLRQYYLAPNLGTPSGDGIEDMYPTARITADAEDGAALTFDSGGAEYHYRAGFVLAGVFASATGLSGACKVEVLSGTTRVAMLSLAPNDAGAAEAMLWLPRAVAPAPLRARLVGAARFVGGTGAIVLEATQQLEYLPEWWDGALLARMAATKGGFADTPGADGRGIDTDFAKTIWDNYAKYGCIVNGTAAGTRDPAEWVNDNPVYDAARRLSRDMVRILNRRQFVSYEVAGGKSIFRFKRWAYGLVNQKADCFAGIAPDWAPVESGGLIEGERYIVRGTGDAHVTYRGGDYWVEETFTAGAEAEFGASGDAAVYVYDGIRHTALPRGYSNEWLLLPLNTLGYHPSESSIFKPAAYADYFAWNQRCHFYSGSISSSRLKRFLNYQNRVDVTMKADGSGYDNLLQPMAVQAEYIAPEGLDAINYAYGANGAGVTANFFRSCRIYEPPVEIESCIVESGAGTAGEVVKITLTGRLRSHENAPATVAADPLTWSAGERESLANAGASPEDYRTDDNAVREYALHQADPSAQCVFRTGDAGTNSSVSFLPDNPFGSCYPWFTFCRLIPEPRAGDGLMDDTDPRCTIDAFQAMEVAARAMCEGFVDGATSFDLVCRTGVGSLYDFTWEALGYQADQSRAVGAFGLVDRPDKPAGHGPLAATQMYAGVFNALAERVNLMTHARVLLPVAFESRGDSVYAGVDTTPDWAAGTTAAVKGGTYPCPHVDLSAVAWSPGLAGISSATFVGLYNAAELAAAGHPITGDWGWYVSRSAMQARITPAQDCLYALPPDLAALLAGNFRLIARQTNVVTWPAPGGASPWRCGGTADCSSGQEWNSLAGAPPLYTDSGDCHTDRTASATSVACYWFGGGNVVAADPPACLHVFWEQAPGIICTMTASVMLDIDLLDASNLAVEVPVVEWGE